MGTVNKDKRKRAWILPCWEPNNPPEPHRVPELAFRIPGNKSHRELGGAAWGTQGLPEPSVSLCYLPSLHPQGPRDKPPNTSPSPNILRVPQALVTAAISPESTKVPFLLQQDLTYAQEAPQSPSPL